jgi:hypothetical protein
MFFDALHEVANVAHRRNPFRGVELVDIYDGCTIRWNPVEVGTVRQQWTDWSLEMRLPGKWVNAQPRRDWIKSRKPVKEFVDSVRSPNGFDYLVDGSQLRLRVPPMLIHMLDGALSALVMEELTVPLKRRSVTRDPNAPVRELPPDENWRFSPGEPLPVIALHDAWYIPGHHLSAARLGEFSIESIAALAVLAAGREWDRRLRPVYTMLNDYLFGTPFQEWAEGIQETWEQRARAPRFVVSHTPKPS